MIDWKKRWRDVLLAGWFIFLPALTFAQADTGCDHLDPTDPCPLDGKVLFILVAAAAIAVCIHLNKKKKLS